MQSHWEKNLLELTFPKSLVDSAPTVLGQSSRSCWVTGRWLANAKRNNVSEMRLPNVPWRLVKWLTPITTQGLRQVKLPALEECGDQHWIIKFKNFHPRICACKWKESYTDTVLWKVRFFNWNMVLQRTVGVFLNSRAKTSKNAISGMFHQYNQKLTEFFVSSPMNN